MYDGISLSGTAFLKDNIIGIQSKAQKRCNCGGATKKNNNTASIGFQVCCKGNTFTNFFLRFSRAGEKNITSLQLDGFLRNLTRDKRIKFLYNIIMLSVNFPITNTRNRA